MGLNIINNVKSGKWNGYEVYEKVHPLEIKSGKFVLGFVVFCFIFVISFHLLNYWSNGWFLTHLMWLHWIDVWLIKMSKESMNLTVGQSIGLAICNYLALIFIGLFFVDFWLDKHNYDKKQDK